MPIIRGHHAFDDYYTQIPNEWVRDARLSFKARGLLTLVMSHSRGWSLSINSLAVQNQEGKDAIRTAINELEKYGYLTRSQVNEAGRFGEAVWTTHDPADLPMAENPMTDNPTPKKNNLKEEQVKNTTVQSAEFDEFWNEYPKKEGKKPAFKAFTSALRRASFEDILAGVIRYKTSDKVQRGFIMLASRWLNEDHWEDYHAPSADSEAAERARLRREREREATEAFLAEQRALEANLRGPATCKHGLTIARCLPCSKELS
jgi:hypothetical protein